MRNEKENNNTYSYWNGNLFVYLSCVCGGSSAGGIRYGAICLNLMAVECQNLSDFAGQAAQNNFGNFDSVKSQFEVAISNFNYLIGPFIPEFIQEFNSAYQNFEPSVSSAQQTAQICQNIRTNTYQKMTQYNGILNPPQDIDTFEKCEQAGYFISGDTCFIGGEYILDKKDI